MFLIFRFLCHLKQNIKNKEKVKGSICNAYLVKEAFNFYVHYFEPHLITWDRQVPHNDDGVDDVNVEGNLSIFKHPSRPYGRAKMSVFADNEYKVAEICLTKLP